MDFKYIVYIVLLLSRNLTTIEGVENTETFKMSDSVYTCSKWLASIIDNFCNNVYKIVKRDTSLILDKLTPKDLLNNRDKRRKIAEMRWRRVRRQVASECCERPCTVETIIMYCPDDAKVLIENPDIFNYRNSN
ncbi:uncharacterized protein LOC123655171 [Melitaea cinxia]|uniref:uncharacterized protein LOC123655171 n=1 Tax=Melitaea cinxia TaxID=113334 RepID=UPI0004EA2303|nr:uncharacterized protein LOC123655171 [Melitaea cinxia]